MKFLKWSLILVVCAPLLLVGSIYIYNKSIGPVGWAEADTIKILRTKMKDPDSVVIRSSYFVQRPDENGYDNIFMCGIVDSKNGFGAYTGGTRFVSKSYSSENSFELITVELEDPEDKRLSEKLGMPSSFESIYWDEYCMNADLQPVIAEKS